MAYQDSVNQMSKWYENNIHTYGSSTFSCNLLSGAKVRADCSGFVNSCMILAGIFPQGSSYTSGQFLQSGPAGQLLAKAGFRPMPWTGFQNCQPYDVLAKNGHVEIYAGDYKSHGWGSRHDAAVGKYMPWYVDKKAQYATVWRLGGVSQTFSTSNPSQSTVTTTNPFQMNFNNMNSGTVYSGGGNYPDPNNYETRTNVFASSEMNTLSITTNQDYSQSDPNSQHTRIYAVGQRTITVDELSMPIDGNVDIGDAQRTYSS